MDRQAFLNLLSLAVQHGVSDIHLAPGAPPSFRMKGELMGVKAPPLTDADMELVVRAMITEKATLDRLPTLMDYDGSFEVKGLCRFRYNVFRNKGRLGTILRVIPAVVPTIEKLGLPPVLKKIAENHRGLVLVTGATGSGKTSTLAAMINHVNATSAAHILTIEDPIEFIHTPQKSRITQREIGRDTATFAGALRSALRQDPDVILVGEMRDPETIDIALKAAETGHMVFSTVHTTDAIKTIGRLVAVFPPNEQQMVRLRLSDCLVGSISQRLITRADNKGRVCVQEIMVAYKAIQECIADPKLTGQMNDFISKSRDNLGSQTFDQHLADLYNQKVVTLEAAMEASTNPADFERNVMLAAEGGAKSAPTGIELQKVTKEAA
jgi:twitching motility protein PilT